MKLNKKWGIQRMAKRSYRAILVVCVFCLVILAGCTKQYENGVVVQKTNDGTPRIQVLLDSGKTEWWTVDEDVYNAFQIDESVTKWKNGDMSVG